jgi:hypothetical protein
LFLPRFSTCERSFDTNSILYILLCRFTIPKIVFLITLSKKFLHLSFQDEGLQCHHLLELYVEPFLSPIMRHCICLTPHSGARRLCSCQEQQPQQQQCKGKRYWFTCRCFSNFLPSPYQITTVLTILAQGVNDAANNGAKGDTAAALAQEAVDEFEAGQAVTAVGPLINHLIFSSINEDKANGWEQTAADAQASANVAKENAVIAGRGKNATANAGAATKKAAKGKGKGKKAKGKAAAQNNTAAGNATANASANNAVADQLVAASGVNDAANNGAKGDAVFTPWIEEVRSLLIEASGRSYSSRSCWWVWGGIGCHGYCSGCTSISKCCEGERCYQEGWSAEV